MTDSLELTPSSPDGESVSTTADSGAPASAPRRRRHPAFSTNMIGIDSAALVGLRFSQLPVFSAIDTLKPIHMAALQTLRPVEVAAMDMIRPVQSAVASSALEALRPVQPTMSSAVFDTLWPARASAQYRFQALDALRPAQLMVGSAALDAMRPAQLAAGSFAADVLHSAGMQTVKSALDAVLPWRQMGIEALFGDLNPARIAMPDIGLPWRQSGFAVSTLAESISALAGLHTSAMANFGAQIVNFARGVEERLFIAILAARDAAIRGDREAVGQFFDRWLELPRSRWRERVEFGLDALLITLPEDFGPEDAFDVLFVIEREANRYFQRRWRPLGETKLNKQFVGYVELLPKQAGADDVPAEQFLPPTPSPDLAALSFLDQLQDERLAVVMGGMTPPEASVIEKWSKRQAGSWEDAAIQSGLPGTDGERIRAKLQRRARQVVTISARPCSPLSR